MKILIFLFLGLNLLFGRAYDISPKQIQKDVFEVNSVIFEFKDLKEWNRLINGTIATETLYGRYSGDGDLSITQISYFGYLFIQKHLDKKDKLKLEILGFPNEIKFEDLKKDNKLAIIYCAFYYKFKLANKPPKNLEECAKAWKKYYNTSLGSGTPMDFINRYHEYAPKTSLF